MEQAKHEEQAKRKALTVTDPAYADALRVVEDRRFRPSNLQAERDCPVCQPDIEDAVEEYADAIVPEKASYAELETLRALCHNKDGLIVSHPLLDHFEDKHSLLDDRARKAQDALNTALEVELVVCITEALELVGITDRALMAEVCRCVVCGGTPGDGLGFTEGRSPDGAKGEGRACPHCGEAADPDALRCPICRRFFSAAAS